MAKAKLKEVTRTEITLKLTAEEAGTLLAIVGKVTGDTSGPRGNATDVWSALNVLIDNQQMYHAHKRAKSLLRDRSEGQPGIHFASDGAQHG